MIAPKLFISYSWTNSVHEKWVLNLSTELRESGVDVILDKWELREGNDKILFMEKMVNDPEVKKVVMVCDELYMEKANGRKGGVGTETQIISKEIYENQSQDKFVAVLPRKDLNGNPFLPTYYNSRIFIDLSEEERYAENFEQLLRWIFDKPLNKKPELGKIPRFLFEEPSVSLGTSSIFKRTADAIRNSKAFAQGSIEEYLDIFSTNLSQFRLTSLGKDDFDSQVDKNITNFLPYRNEYIQLVVLIAQYSPTNESISKIHRFLEILLSYMERPIHINQWSERDFDNYKFIIHELFLYTIAIFLKYEKFELCNHLLKSLYYIPNNLEFGRESVVTFHEFRKPIHRFIERSRQLRIFSFRANLLKERSNGVGVDFRLLVQSDFILFMRSQIKVETSLMSWWPELSVYMLEQYGPFEIFSRSKSKQYFERIKGLIGIMKLEEIDDWLNRVNKDSLLPNWEGETINPKRLIGRDKLASIP